MPPNTVTKTHTFEGESWGGEKKSSIVQLVSPIAQWNLMLEGAHVWIDKDGDM